VDAADLAEGALTGKAIVGADGKALVTVKLAADAVTETVETLKLAVDGTTVSTEVTVNDTSLTDSATYKLTSNEPTVKEGEWIDFILETTGVPAGTEIAYTLSGVDAADLAEGDLLTGKFTVGEDGKAFIQVHLAADKLTEGTENLIISLDGKEVSAAVEVDDISKTNQAPTVEELDNVTTTDAETSLFAGVVVTDAEDNWDGGKVIVDVTEGIVLGDKIVVALDSDISLVDDLVTIKVEGEDVVIGSYEGGTTTLEKVGLKDVTTFKPLVITFNENADSELVDKVLHAIKFDAQDGYLGERTVSLEVVDGEGASHGPEFIAVNVLTDKIAITDLADDNTLTTINDGAIAVDASQNAGLKFADALGKAGIAGSQLTVALDEDADPADTLSIQKVAGIVRVLSGFVLVDTNGMATGGEVNIGKVTGNGSHSLTITFNDKATDGLIATVLQNVVFDAKTVDSDGDRTVTFTVTPKNDNIEPVSVETVVSVSSSRVMLTSGADTNATFETAETPVSETGINVFYANSPDDLTSADKFSGGSNYSDRLVAKLYGDVGAPEISGVEVFDLTAMATTTVDFNKVNGVKRINLFSDDAANTFVLNNLKDDVKSINASASKGDLQASFGVGEYLTASTKIVGGMGYNDRVPA
jgi:hypothetical protein